jgi:putative transposase
MAAPLLGFMQDINFEPSMSRRGNCHDNAVAESFFATFKNRSPSKKSTQRERKPRVRYSILLKCSTIR